jgi:hypothetical protein
MRPRLLLGNQMQQSRQLSEFALAVLSNLKHGENP